MDARKRFNEQREEGKSDKCIQKQIKPWTREAHESLRHHYSRAGRGYDSPFSNNIVMANLSHLTNPPYSGKDMAASGF